MTPEQFESAVSRTRLKPPKIAAARRVLVDGIGKSEAGRELNLQRSVVWDAVARIQREYKSMIGCPQAWEVVTVTVPREEGETIRDIERAAWRRAGLLVD